MAKFYNVWVELEEHDDRRVRHVKLGVSVGFVACFTNAKQAQAFAASLQAVGEAMEKNPLSPAPSLAERPKRPRKRA